MFVGWGKKFGKTCNFATLGVVDCDADFSQGDSGDQVFTCPHLSLQGCPSYSMISLHKKQLRSLELRCFAPRIK